MFWKWALIVGLSMTPALILGQSAACAAGVGFGFSWAILVPVIAVSGFLEGLVLSYIAPQSQRFPRIHRFLQRFHKPQAVEWAKKHGPWGGILLGVAFVGQEPIIVALKWIGVETRRMLLPLALSNVIYTVIYYLIVAFGIDKAMEVNF